MWKDRSYWCFSIFQLWLFWFYGHNSLYLSRPTSACSVGQYLPNTKQVKDKLGPITYEHLKRCSVCSNTKCDAFFSHMCHMFPKTCKKTVKLVHFPFFPFAFLSAGIHLENVSISMCLSCLHSHKYITLCALEATFIEFSDTGGETQVSSIHMTVSQETVCVDWVPQCSQSFTRRLKAVGRALACRIYLHLQPRSHKPKILVLLFSILLRKLVEATKYNPSSLVNISVGIVQQ